MVIKRGSYVFVMTYVGERCALVGVLDGIMYPDKDKKDGNSSPMVKLGEYAAMPMSEVQSRFEVRRFVRLKNVVWTNGKKLLERKDWREKVEGRWVLALELESVSDEEWLGYAL